MQDLIDQYLAGRRQLRDSIAGMSRQQIDTAPIAGKWSRGKYICHIADFEPVYADRMRAA